MLGHGLIQEARLGRQLQPLGKAEADCLTSLAVGIDQLLHRDTVLQAFLGRQLLPAIAVLYGTALRTCIEAATDERVSDHIREIARETRSLMEHAVALTDAPDPEPPVAQDSEDFFRSLMEKLAQSGAEKVEG